MKQQKSIDGCEEENKIKLAQHRWKCVRYYSFIILLQFIRNRRTDKT